jgi:nucleoside-diphosphate-sugar epimerase
MNKIFITGGSGFTGYHFHQKVSEERIINYDIQEPFFEYDSEFIKGDIRDTERLAKHLKKGNKIIHLAATHFDFQTNYFETNVEGTRSLLQAARKADINKIIFFSTVAVYGSVSEPTSERSKVDPDSPYGKSKLEAERLVIDWAKEEPTRSAIILRPTVVYGPYNFGNVFNLIKQIDSGLFINIGDGENVKSIVFVKNLVDYTLQLMEKMGPGISIHNATDIPHLSTKELTKIIANELDKKISFTLPLPIAKFLVLPFDVLNTITGKDWIISRERIEKFCADTHFLSKNLRKNEIFQRFNTEEGIKKTIKWYHSVDTRKLYNEWLSRVERYS